MDAPDHVPSRRRSEAAPIPMTEAASEPQETASRTPMKPLFRWLATPAQRERIVAAAARSVCGSDITPSPEDDRFTLVCRGHDPPGADLDAGRAEGGVPVGKVAEWIATFLAADRRHLALFEDPVHSIDDPAVVARDRPCWVLPHGVAWPMVAGEDAAAVLAAISMHRGGPRTILLFRMPSDWRAPGDGAPLATERLEALRAAVCAVLTDGYDGDAWLIWDRRVSTLPGIDLDHDTEPGMPGEGDRRG